jgi:hypothetical protein
MKKGKKKEAYHVWWKWNDYNFSILYIDYCNRLLSKILFDVVLYTPYTFDLNGNKQIWEV